MHCRWHITDTMISPASPPPTNQVIRDQVTMSGYTNKKLIFCSCMAKETVQYSMLTFVFYIVPFAL